MTGNLNSSLNPVCRGLVLVILIAIVVGGSNYSIARSSPFSTADSVSKSKSGQTLESQEEDFAIRSLPALPGSLDETDSFQSLHPLVKESIPQKLSGKEELGSEFQSAYQHLRAQSIDHVRSEQLNAATGEPVSSSTASNFRSVPWNNRMAPSTGYDRDFVPESPQFKNANYALSSEGIAPAKPIDGSAERWNLSLSSSDRDAPITSGNRSEIREFDFNMSSIDQDVDGINDPSIERDLNSDASLMAMQNPLIWWRSLALEPLNAENQTQQVDIHSLVYLALKNSPRIQAISQNPLISELQVIESETVFDPIRFVESNYNDRNDPVGNTLITGGPPFLRDNIWDANAGIRKLTRTGANVELNQRLGFQNSNSNFFVPQDQGTATLALNVSQPLLRGRGRYINQTQILIAQATGMVAWDAFAEELQIEIERILQAYWRLYYQRSIFLQKQRNVQRGREVLRLLEGRSELDSLPSQTVRARSAIENRRTELANAYRDVRNSETEIRRLIADREWLAGQNIELIPAEMPLQDTFDVPLESVVQTALENRPEVKQALQQARINNIRLDIANNQILPDLTFLIGGYVSALNGNSGVLNSLADQFGNRPGYNVGLAYEMPYRNRAARSRLAQQKLQIAKVKAEVDEAMQQVIADSQIALRRIESAVQTRIASQTAISAATDDLQHQQRRWEAFGLIEGDMMEGQNATLLLNQVLDAQERLAAAELIFAQSELELKIAEIGLQRAMGTLLIHQKIDSQMTNSHDNPQLVLEKQ